MENKQQTGLEWLMSQIENNVLCDHRIISELEYWQKSDLLGLIEMAIKIDGQSKKPELPIGKRIFDLAIEVESTHGLEKANYLHQALLEL